MKYFKRIPLFIWSLALIAVAAVCLLSSAATQKAYAATDYEYGFEYTAFHVEYNVRADRTMDVELNLGVHYSGIKSTGIMFDIPVNAGDRVRNVTACELSGGLNGEEIHLDYDVTNEDLNLITVDMGDYTLKRNQTHYYRIRYEYAITKPAKNEKNAIFLNAVGFGHTTTLDDVQVTVNLPDGFIGDLTKCYAGLQGTNAEYRGAVDIDGNRVTLNIEHMNEKNGITFNFFFEEGVLSVKPDLTPYWIIIAACVLLALLFAVKLLVFNKDGLTPVVGVEAPDEMDPLVMGKLIDNKVDKSDVTSLIYYWANKGYIKIDLRDESDIELIRLYKQLPADAPNYQKRMYNGLFGKNDLVKINSLANKFYTTVEAVTKEVNAESGKLYTGSSMGVAVLFALLGAMFMGITPIALALTGISFKLFTVLPMFMIVPSFIIFALTQTVRYNRLKYTKGKTAVRYLGIVALAAVFTIAYALFIPSYIIEVIPKIILCAVGFAIVMLSSLIISRTPAHVEKLNKIVGFREFILSVEKDKLEMMLEENPELYYQILPYAIVLGVSDIWENKFSALTLAPPNWASSSRNAAFNFVVFNSLMRNANNRMTATMNSRPAPSSGSYSGGGRSGGSFGGFSGGGHGGGGSRGR